MPAHTPKKQIPHDWLKKNAALLSGCMQKWKTGFENAVITGPELVGIYLLIFIRLYHRHQWYGGRLEKSITSKCPSQLALSDIALSAGLDFSSCANISLIDFFANHRLRGVSLRAQRALVAWANNEYAIDLALLVPLPRILLDIQAEGRRIVSLFLDEKNLTRPFLNRDPLTFVLHDLEHADEFFFDPVRQKAQVRFYQGMKKILDAQILDELVRTDPLFKQDLDYVISDMNSHPAHLHATLLAYIYESLRRTGKSSDAEKFTENVNALISGFHECTPVPTPYRRPQHL